MYDVSPQPNNIATAPPMDEFQHVPVRYPPPIQTQYAYTTPTHQLQYVYPYAQPTLPPPSSAPQPFHYIQNAQQYRLDEIERQQQHRQQRQQDTDCCCLAILATLCCCFVNSEI
jgi:hypothetical protein